MESTRHDDNVNVDTCKYNVADTEEISFQAVVALVYPTAPAVVGAAVFNIGIVLKRSSGLLLPFSLE